MRTRRELIAIVAVLASTLAVRAGDERREISFPDIPAYMTLMCDFHAHSVFSDGEVWPTQRIDEAWREGLDAIAITDHIEYHPHKADVSDNPNRSYELMEKSARQHDVLLIRGAELTHDTPPGHFNAIFISDGAPLKTSDFYGQFEQAAGQGAFIFWNHPGWQGAERGRWGEEQTRLFEKGWLKGIEICNGDDYYREAHQWAVEKGLTLLGDSDIHAPSNSTWTAAQHRTLTLVFAQERTLAAIQAALAEGRTAVWRGNRLYGREAELLALFSASVRVHAPHYRAGDEVWLRIENACELDLELQRASGAGPGRLRLPARASVIVHVRSTASQPTEELVYQVTNMLSGPDQGLRVRLEIPRE